MKNMEKVCNEAVEWIKDRVNSAGAKGVVLGMSGGIDSAVVAALVKRAFPKDCFCVTMPCYSDPVDEEHAKLVADAVGIEMKTVILNDAFDTMKNSVGATESDPKLAIANIKSRLRMVTLYYYAGVNNYLVAGTGNRSELTIGYFTKYGDGGTDMLPIASFVKKEVRALAEYLGIPEIIITKAPTAGLWENQSDEKEMGMTYEELDNYILTGEAREEVKTKVDMMFNRSEHKRATTPKFVPTEKL
ncbi:MAG TPA: NAD(+) synthase [Patescibacteria group bacterium]|nr:NAD(+) synthase [Patescibacteria group bacterium]